MEAIADIEDGMTVMIGGFGGAGSPIELMAALLDRFRKTGKPRSLTVVSNNAGNGRVGLAALISQGMIAKMICSFPRSSDPIAFTDKYREGAIDLELVPQGTLAERIRCGGSGIPAFFTATAVGTELADGKPHSVFDGRTYIMERWLKADVALIKADVADRYGNLTYRKTSRNFSPLMASAASLCIVQAHKIVDPGTIDPEAVITPGIFVDRIVEVPNAVQEEELLLEVSQSG